MSSPRPPAPKKLSLRPTMAQDFNCEVSPEVRAKIFEVAKASNAGNISEKGRGAVGSKVWSDDEVSVMTRVLQSLDHDQHTTLQLCVLVAVQLPSKNVRDVASRLILLRNQDPETASVAAAAMGAVAAAAGVSVPGASTSDTSGTWRDPVAMFSGPNSVIDGNRPSSFPFELQVAQLLQENMILIEELRANVLAAKFAENVSLMEAFHKNVATVFSMLSSLPCALPPLPVQYKICNPFLSHMSPQYQHSLRLEQFQHDPAANPSLLLPPGEPGSAYGLQAGIAFPFHPNSTQGSARSSSSSSSSSSTASSSSSSVPVMPSNIATDIQGSTLPAPSPANGALQALPHESATS